MDSLKMKAIPYIPRRRPIPAGYTDSEGFKKPNAPLLWPFGKVRPVGFTQRMRAIAEKFKEKQK